MKSVRERTFLEYWKLRVFRKMRMWLSTLASHVWWLGLHLEPLHSEGCLSPPSIWFCEVETRSFLPLSPTHKKVSWVSWGHVIPILWVRKPRLREVKGPAIKWSRNLKRDLIQTQVLSTDWPLLLQGVPREDKHDEEGVAGQKPREYPLWRPG